MVEPILYASLGALLATLIGLMFLPIFWRRAVRLTTKRLIGRLPVSAAEIVASQDRLRAENAMAMRATERRAERTMSEATRDRVESARARATELGHLADLADLRSQISALEAEGVKMRGERDKSGEEAAAAHRALQEARAAADAAARELQAARQDASAARSATEQARVETAARAAEIVALRARLAPKEPGPAAAGPAAAAPAPSADDLAVLRARLDEVADALVKAAEADPATRPARDRAPASGAEPLRVVVAERAGA
jgi:hypothetical protein